MAYTYKKKLHKNYGKKIKILYDLILALDFVSKVLMNCLVMFTLCLRSFHPKVQFLPELHARDFPWPLQAPTTN